MRLPQKRDGGGTLRNGLRRLGGRSADPVLGAERLAGAANVARAVELAGRAERRTPARLRSSKHDALAMHSVGDAQAEPSGVGPSGMQARAVPVSVVGGHQVPAPQSVPKGVQVAPTSSTVAMTRNAPEPTVTITPSVWNAYGIVLVAPLKTVKTTDGFRQRGDHRREPARFRRRARASSR